MARLLVLQLVLLIQHDGEVGGAVAGGPAGDQEELWLVDLRVIKKGPG